MSNLDPQLETIEAFSEPYREEYIEEPPADNMEYRDENGVSFRLRFFLKRMFASARREELSAQYREVTETVLTDDEGHIRDCWERTDGGSTADELKEVLATEGVGNQHDRQMVVEILDFRGTLDRTTIHEYIRAAIRENTIDEAYNALTDIHNVGPKKATLYLRDTATLLLGEEMETDQFDEHIEDDQYHYLVPIDTWVFQVGDNLGLFSTDGPQWNTNSKKIVEACDEEVSPLKFDQGAWYLGNNAFDILIENLDAIDQETT